MTLYHVHDLKAAQSCCTLLKWYRIVNLVVVYMGAVLLPFKRQQHCLLSNGSCIKSLLACWFHCFCIIVERWRTYTKALVLPSPTSSFWESRAFKDIFPTCCCTLHCINTCHILLLNIVDCMQRQLQPLGNSCRGELHQPNSRCFVTGSAAASFGHGHCFPGTRTAPTKQQKGAQATCHRYKIASALA